MKRLSFEDICEILYVQSMQLYTGTSGYSFKEWNGPFYPEDMKPDEMLAYYASQLPAVEINNTFCRAPKSVVVQRWAEDVPDGFRFVLKALQRISHRSPLVHNEEAIHFLARALAHPALHEPREARRHRLPARELADRTASRELANVRTSACS